MTRHLTIGFSPCPNDTFIFYALVHNRVMCRQVSFAAPILEDVETLNLWAFQGKLDVTKLSFHAMGHLLDSYVVLSSGAALGRGCGPLLVKRAGGQVDLARARIVIPGEYTTAAMLLKLFAPEAAHIRTLRFEEIMGAVASDQADCGVIIHESRFTYRDHGLEIMEDLGQWWEEETGLPIPLGCIAARRSLPVQVLAEIDEAVRQSLEWARANPEQAMMYIRQYAQEMNEKVLCSHIDLYVNDFSLDMGNDGKEAVEELFRRGRSVGIFPAPIRQPWCLG